MSKDTMFSGAGRKPGVLTCVAAGVVLSACASSTPAPAPPAGQELDPPPGTPVAPSDPEAAVRQVYAEYWRISSPGKDVELDAQWEDALRTVATEEQTTQLAHRARAQRARGTTVYGQVQPRVTDVRIERERARVTDCQDASHVGQADLATGERKTVGVARNPVTATATREPDGSWRVEGVAFPGGQC